MHSESPWFRLLGGPSAHLPVPLLREALFEGGERFRLLLRAEGSLPMVLRFPSKGWPNDLPQQLVVRGKEALQRGRSLLEHLGGIGRDGRVRVGLA